MLSYCCSSTVYPGFFCHSHLCIDLSFDLYVIFGSFSLASLVLQISSLATKIKDLFGNPWLPLGVFTVSAIAVLKWETMESKINFFVQQRGKWCYFCWNITQHCVISRFLEFKPDSWLGWFPCFHGRRVLKVIITTSQSLITATLGNVRVLAFWYTVPERNRLSITGALDGWVRVLRPFQQYFSHFETMEG